MTLSNEPYSVNQRTAVLGPTKDMPGILSLVSPINAFKSGMRSGPTPISYSTNSGVNILFALLLGATTDTCSVTNCKASLSVVTM